MLYVLNYLQTIIEFDTCIVQYMFYILSYFSILKYCGLNKYM